MRYLLGVDDSDSQFGLCTTYLGYRLVLKLLENGCRLPRYPRLVRLNPNVPFKTRGNAAVCLEFETADPDPVFEKMCSVVEEYSDTSNGANTGAVMVGARPPAYFATLYERALCGLVNRDGVLRSISTLDARLFTLGNGMGVVGASAAIGFDPLEDHTYELLAYRKRESYGTPRRVDHESVMSMDKLTFPHTFNNYDHETERVMITPHGPDPVLLGIRGDSPEVVMNAFSMVRCSEDVEGHVVYLSNQHTDAHLRRRLQFPLRAFSSGWIEGRVGRVEIGMGAHVYFTLDTGIEKVGCAVYEPTGDLQRTARSLKRGDLLRVSGGIRRPSARHPRLVNVERIDALALRRFIHESNPTCQNCGVRMKSEGRGKGYQCPRCKTRAGGGKVSRPAERLLQKGSYVASARSQRHLTKQLIRYGNELDGKSAPLVEEWIGSEPLRPLRAPVRNP